MDKAIYELCSIEVFGVGGVVVMCMYTIFIQEQRGIRFFVFHQKFCTQDAKIFKSFFILRMFGYSIK